MSTTTFEVYGVGDAEESDPDPIYVGNHAGMCNALGNVTLQFLFNDAVMQHDVYHVLDAHDVVIAVAYG